MTTKKKPIPYTKEEDAVIIKYVTLYPTNLRQAFRLAAQELKSRDADSCMARWYSYLKNNGGLTVTTGSSAGFTHNGKNTPVDKNGDMPDQGLSPFQNIVKIMLNDPKLRNQVLSFFNPSGPKPNRTVVHTNS